MKEVCLCFTEEELLELAKQLTMASVFNYNNEKQEALADSIRLKVCAAGYKEFNANADYKMGGPFEAPFVISREHDDDIWESSIEPRQNHVIKDYIATRLADRDFCKKHKKITPENFFSHPVLVQELEERVNEYKWELMLNGMENFKLVQQKKRRKE